MGLGLYTVIIEQIFLNGTIEHGAQSFPIYDPTFIS